MLQNSSGVSPYTETKYIFPVCNKDAAKFFIFNILESVMQRCQNVFSHNFRLLHMIPFKHLWEIL